MKKLFAMLCMLTCIFGLTACGEKTEISEFQAGKAETAVTMATQFVVPMMTNFFDDKLASDFQESYNVHELKAVMEDQLNYQLYMYSQYGMNFNFNTIEVEGNAILNGIVSFNSAYATLGEVVPSGDKQASYKISGDEIIVTVPLEGTKTDENGNVKTAEAEVIFSNDVFLKVQSCTLNIEQTMGDLMAKAAADTVMGMGVVFVILILISFLIAGLGMIPKLMDKLSRKNKKEVKTDAVDNTIAQIIEKEESTEYADDYELAAVIAAAVAAYEGSSSTDGFVVRSIIRR